MCTSRVWSFWVLCVLRICLTYSRLEFCFLFIQNYRIPLLHSFDISYFTKYFMLHFDIFPLAITVFRTALGPTTAFYVRATWSLVSLLRHLMIYPGVSGCCFYFQHHACCRFSKPSAFSTSPKRNKTMPKI
jgi:hypothetical protein